VGAGGVLWLPPVATPEMYPIACWAQGRGAGQTAVAQGQFHCRPS